ncbi:MAG: class I SAM-dependent methyltransferase, partial [Planctomycetota bacterium]
MPGGQVLDIGCSQGEFLAGWGPQWVRFGIEPNEEAREACSSRGIRLVGHVIEDLARCGEQFDVICMMDLLEHLPDPAASLRPIATRLREGGALVVETGDTRSLLATVMGADWHYYGAPEHIAFYCESALMELFRRL